MTSSRSHSTSALEDFDSFPDLLFLVSRAGVILDYRGGRDAQLYAPPDAFLGRSLSAVLPPPVATRLEEAIARVSHTQAPVAVDYTLSLPGGAREFEARLLPLTPEAVLAVCRDITDTPRLILRASHIGCWSWLNSKVEWDETTRALFDRPDTPADYAAYLDCIHPDDRHRVNANIERFLREARYEDIEHRVVRSDGTVRWLFARGAPVLDASGAVLGLQGVILDITERRLREELLADEASTDALTRLRNRRWLAQEGRREVARCTRGAAPFSLVLLDVDDFKQINDGPGGHDTGDRMLVQLAARLQEQIRLGDVLLRLGGDEIVAFLPQTGPEMGDSVARRLALAVAGQPFEGINSTVSVGVATWEPGDEFDDVLRRADRKMYRAKHLKSPGG